jgi:hypothetical protein
MKNLNKRIERLEKSLPTEPKRPPAMIFVNPGETTEQKIAEYKAANNHTGDDFTIIRFVEPGEDLDHDN